MAVSRRMWLKEQERKRRERARKTRRKRRLACIIFLLAVLSVGVVIIRGCTTEKDAINETVNSLTETPNTAVQTQTPLSNDSVQVENVDNKFFEKAVFIGNALAAGISKYGILPNTDIYAAITIDLDNVYNTAANNDSMAIVDQLKSKKFSRVFLCFGELELQWEDSAEFSDKYKELVKKVKSYQQNASIYIISIPPVTKNAATINSYNSLSNIKAYNKVLQQIAATEKIYYVDSFNAIGNGGYLDESVSADGINLDRARYTILLNYISENSYIPKLSDLEDDDTEYYSDSDSGTDESGNVKNNDSNNDETETTQDISSNVKKSTSDKTEGKSKTSGKTSSAAEPVSGTESPEPMVNVMKNSHIESK